MRQNEAKLNADMVEAIVREKVQQFIAEKLKDRYDEFVSKIFIEAYIVYHFEQMYREYPQTNSSDLAYKSCVVLFELLLEHGYRAGGNGHHVAQSFAEMFPYDKTLEEYFEQERLII